MIILVILVNTILAGSACYYIQNNSQMLNSSTPYGQMDQFTGVGYGYWFKYQPYTDINIGSEFTSTQTYASGSQKQTNQKYLLSVEQFNRTTYTIFHYVTIDSQSSTILHQVDVLSKNRFQIINKTFTPLNYEGKWIFFGIQFDQNIQILFYLDSLTIFQIDDQIRITTNMRYYLGWYGTIQSSYNNSFLTFSQFNGRITNFIILNEFITQQNKETTILGDCAQINYCKVQNLQLIFTQYVFKALSLTQFNFNTYYDGDRYAIYLWVKANPQLSQGTQTTVLLRITLNSPYSDQKIGDKELYIEYVQSPQPTLNGINITTYTYSFPADGPYTITTADRVQINSSALLLGLTYWHYIQYEYGRTTSTYNSLFTLFVPSIGYTATADWKRRNYHFTGSSLYFYIGGGTQSNENLFSGTIFNLTLLTCFNSDLSLLNKCDYTCETCSGPTSTDCLTCFQDSNRELSFSQCLCKDGFVETGQNVQCYYISYIYPSLLVIENEYPCTLVGYDQCGDKIVCSFGYFLTNNSCYKCPEQQNKDLNQNLFCMECLLNPTSWDFVCTYDLLSQSSNQVFIQTLKNNHNLYNLNQINDYYEFQFCEGYSRFCNPKCQLNFTIPSSSIYTNFLCQKEYYVSNDSCQFCGEGCDCSDTYPCAKCQTGYAFNLFSQSCDKCDICTSCLYKSDVLICSYCPSQYYLNSQGQCIKCGYGCSSCDQTGCLYCFSGYFSTFDGINCQQCTLSNCKVCYQYYVDDGWTYQTIDLYIDHINISDQNVQTVCARCSDSYYIYQGNCVIQSSLSQFDTQSATSSQSTNTDYIGGTSGGNVGTSPILPTSVFDQCTTGIVLNDAIVCLIGQSYSAKESSSCTRVSNCQNCISNYVDLTNLCIICVNGFFVNLLSGECQQCPDDCPTCVQQHKMYKDAWKRWIRAYYQVVYNSNGDHLFEDYALDSDISNYEVICLSCVKGKLLYNDGCITDCGSNCENCQVMNGVAKCMQCKQNTFGYIRSTNSTEFCINCPYRCSGCIIRGKTASNKINLYYDYDNVDDNSYSNQCYQQYDTSTFLDNEINVAVKCTKYRKCYNSISITINAFCNVLDFNSQFNIQQSILSFRQSNCYIDDLENKINSYFDSGLLDYLNKIAIKNAEIRVNLIQGRASLCQFSNVNLKQLIRQEVFSLLNVSLTITADNTANLQINKQLKIENFNNVTFSNIKFIVSSYAQIYLEAKEPIYVNIINCFYILNGSDVLTFLLENLQKLTIYNINMIVNQVYIQDAQIFKFVYNDEYVIDGQVYIDGFIINQSQFLNTTIFLINYQYSDQPLFTTTINNMQFIDSIFYQGFKFYNQKKALVDVGNVFINNLTITQCQFNKSSIVLANNVYSSYIYNLTIQNSIIQQSTLFQIVVLLVVNVQILNNQILSSQIFSNVGNYYTIDPTEDVLFQNIIFSSNQYIGSQIFIKIIQESDQNLKVKMQTIQMINNSYSSIYQGYQTFQSLSYTNSNIYINADYVHIQDLIIFRAPGLPEISIIQSINLTIDNIQISTLSMYRSKILSPTIECFQKQSYLDFYFSLFIYDYLQIYINQIGIQSVYSFDYAIIVLQSANLLSKQQNELINITDGTFISNQMLIQNNNKQTGIIQIKSQQVQTIYLKNLIFSYNILNQYVQDLSKYSSSTLMIESDQGDLIIDNCEFTQNYLINSTNSPLQIQTQSIHLSHTKFTNNNVFDFEIIKYFIIWGYSDDVSYEQIYQSDLQIQSSGGSGQFVTQYLVMQNVSLIGSYGLLGGGFYISLQGYGQIILADSCFSQSQTADIINANGGLFYIDAEKSKLFLEINNVDVKYVKSRTQGGFLFLNPSQKYNYIQIQNVKCTNCFSFVGGFIIIEFSTSSTQVQYPTLFMDNITLSNPDIQWQLERTFSLTTNEVNKISTYSYLIFLRQIILQLSNFNVHDGSLYGILYIEGVNGIFINQISILDYQPFQTPLISISQSTNSSAEINLQNIFIHNITQQRTLIQQADCNTALKQIFSSKYKCPIDFNYNQMDQSYITSTYYTAIYQSNNYDCNSYSIYGGVQSTFGVFEIIDSTLSIIKILNITMQYINYNFLTYGILSIRDYTIQQNSIKISNLNLLNNKCDRAGCLLIVQDSGLIHVDLSATSVQNSRILSENYEELQNLSKFTTIIYQSNFINNTAVNGSGIYILNTNTVIRQCKFYGNNASQYGGAIYFSDSTTNLYLYENIISNNFASQTSGSGIFLLDKAMPKIQNLDVYINNNGDQDINELPYSLQLSLDQIKTFLNKTTITNNQSVFVEMIQINPYKIFGQKEKENYIMLPSGQTISSYQYFDPYQQLYIPYNLSLRVTPINKSGQKLYNLNDFKLKIKAEIVNQTNANSSNSSVTYVSTSEIKYNSTTQDFNLDYFQIYFNPYSNTQLELTLECNGISRPVYSSTPPYDMEALQSYQLKFRVQTFPCQLGEYYNSANQTCLLCTGSTYSVQYNSTSCTFKDDKTTSAVNQAMLKIQSGYWRAYYYSEIIDNCYHLTDNCLGGWKFGDSSCSKGHIGALCEQCDLYNIRGQGSYSVASAYSCGSCAEVSGNALTIFLISIWTLISILMSVDSTVDIIEEHILKVKLKQLGYIIVDQRGKYCFYFLQKASPAVLIKVFTNYLQIITTISTFQLQVPTGISTVFNSVGNPIQSMSYSLDCFLVNLSSIKIIYFRIIWSLLLALLYIIVFLLGFFIAIQINKTTYNITVITTCLIYIYIYLQPNLVGSLISLISYRLISSQYWIQGNVSFRYDTQDHAKWLLSFVFPLLLIIGFIMPFLLWYGVHKNRDHLELTKIKKRWGYLYNEYRSSAYYWETVKILQRQYVIIVLAYYEDFIPIKAALVFLCLFFYSFITNVKKPYNTGAFNILDAQQTIVCAVSVILATTIYTAQQFNLQEIIWPFYLIIAILNTLFVLKLLFCLIEAYTSKLQENIDKIKDKILEKFPDLLNKYPFLKQFLENQDKRKKRIHNRYLQIKAYLIPQAKLIIQFKKDNHIALSERHVSIEDLDHKSPSENKSMASSPLQSSSIRSDDEKLKFHSSPKVYPLKEEYPHKIKFDPKTQEK